MVGQKRRCLLWRQGVSTEQGGVGGGVEGGVEGVDPREGGCGRVSEGKGEGAARGGEEGGAEVSRLGNVFPRLEDVGVTGEGFGRNEGGWG